MAAIKLVKNLLMLVLFCTDIKHMKGMPTGNEAENALDAHIVYDQRQSGKYNIHVVIKDVAIIEMDQNEIAEQNYDDQEYYYDEEDLTVKPLNIKTTSASFVKPVDVLANANTTLPTVQTTTPSIESSSLNPTELDKPKKPNHTEAGKNQTKPRPIVDTKSRSKIEPIYAIEEPALQHSHRLGVSNRNLPVQAKDASSMAQTTNSKVFKVKLHRSHQPFPKERCRSFQYRDGRGNCRGRSSSSGTML